MNMSLEEKKGKSVVLGATGNMGMELVRCLLRNGTETVAFARSRVKLNELMNRLNEESLAVHLLQLVQGDVFDQNQLIEVCNGADTIYQSVNVPYSEWEARLIPLATNVVQAAKAAGAKIIAVDNIYGYGRRKQELVDETHPRNPHTKKGKLRLAMEQVWEKAIGEGMSVAIFKLPDFYGPDAPNTLLHYTFSAIAAGKSSMYIGDQTVPREFVYVPDAATAIVQAAANPEAYGKAWNIAGAGAITGSEIIRIASEEAGYTKRVGTVGPFMMRLAGISNKQYREYVEMMYLVQEPLILNGAAYEASFGPLPKTPYRDGIIATIRSLRRDRQA